MILPIEGWTKKSKNIRIPRKGSFIHFDVVRLMPSGYYATEFSGELLRADTHAGLRDLIIRKLKYKE